MKFIMIYSAELWRTSKVDLLPIAVAPRPRRDSSPVGQERHVQAQLKLDAISSSEITASSP